MANAPNLRARTVEALKSDKLRAALANAVDIATRKREESLAKLCGKSVSLMNMASEIRLQALSNLSEYLDRFTHEARSAGAQVHFADSGDAACRIVSDLLKSRGITRVLKSKSMVTEEIALNEALAEHGIEAVETDLGEYIVQLAGEKPSHVTAPAIHKSRSEIGRLFAEKLGVQYTDDPKVLTKIAARILRSEFSAVSAGITGANFAVADTGSIVLFTNEGNGRLVSTGPPLHIVVTSIDKIIPSINDLPVFIKLLPRSATGQAITSYVSVITGPHRSVPGKHDRQVNIVLLDNGRSGIINGPFREILKCIRCGACMNVCPVYRLVGGHAYGSTYAGPLGIVLTNALHGIANAYELLDACTLCGKCNEVCPVKVPLSGLIRRLRGLMTEQRRSGVRERILMRLFGKIARSPVLYRFAQKGLRVLRKSLPGRFGHFAGSGVETAPFRFRR